jgi:hypothetical protein
MRVRILELSLEVVVSRDAGLTCNGTGNSANEIIAGLYIARSSRDKRGAGELLTVKFVDKDTFEGVLHCVSMNSR